MIKKSEFKKLRMVEQQVGVLIEDLRLEIAKMTARLDADLYEKDREEFSIAFMCGVRHAMGVEEMLYLNNANGIGVALEKYYESTKDFLIDSKPIKKKKKKKK